MEKEFQVPSNIPVIEKPEDFKTLPGVHFTENAESIEKSIETPGIKTVEKPVGGSSTPNIRQKPGIKFGEKTFEGYEIPDNIPVFEKPEDVYQPTTIKENIIEKTETEIETPKEVLSEEEKDIWESIESDFEVTQFIDKSFQFTDIKFDKERLFQWLKEKLSGVSFCQVYLTDKLDGENGIVKENSSLILETDNGSKMYLDKSGKYHRLDGPAIEWYYGAKEWFRNGIRHRVGGAAYESKDEKQYWFEGKQYTEDEYWLIAKEITSLK